MPKLTQTAIRLDMPALFWPTFLLLLDYYRLNSFSYILGLVVELNQTLERVASVQCHSIQTGKVKKLLSKSRQLSVPNLGKTLGKEPR
jgi:hypothetical protein